ncbi:hypothetical protein HAHE_17360 [Haloferula helveola]|uniref:Uncharacterized protein n=1 Tax=Haloferula helveola TaxID=490095 RepID=A0ABM7RJR4_9BACT|nr:hypothetical protein HAHE_17360 [Haloferula helveola]
MPSPGRAIAFAVGLALACQGAIHAPTDESLPVAKQTGPSCGFFANVPAVTLATGIDMTGSKPFVSSIYGLRRGDFRYQRSFDKRMFFELFSLPYETAEIEHPPAPVDSLLPAVRKIIKDTFHQGLDDGNVYSLRIRGVFEGPHNGLLMGREDDRYLLHDPYPGVIRKPTLDELATLMLVRSTSKKNRGKKIYVTHYLTVPLSERAAGLPSPIRSLPGTLEARLSANQRSQLAEALNTERLGERKPELANCIDAFPDLDFAAVPGTKEGTVRSVIGRDVKASELGGVLHLAKFTLNTWHLKRRPLLPVVMMDGRPWALTRYLATDADRPKTPTLEFDNGRERMWLTAPEALQQIRKSGGIYATVKVDWE